MILINDYVGIQYFYAVTMAECTPVVKYAYTTISLQHLCCSIPKYAADHTYRNQDLLEC